MADNKPSFTIVALAPFCGQQDGLWQQAPVEVDPAHIDGALSIIKPSLSLDIPQHLCPRGGLSLTFSSLADFGTDGLLDSNPYLMELMAAATFLDEARRTGLPQDQVDDYFAKRGPLPPIMLSSSSSTEISPEAEGADTALDSILSMVEVPASPASSPETAAKPGSYRDIAHAILDIISQQALFQQLAAAWFGLDFLCRRIANIQGVKLIAIPLTSDLVLDYLNTRQDDISSVEPSMLLFDLPVSNTAVSMDMLNHMATFADNQLVPTFSWVGPQFFGMRDWGEMDRLSFLPNLIDQAEYATFRKLRSLSPGTWLHLSCNRFAAGYTAPSARTLPTTAGIRQAVIWLAPVWGVAALICQSLNRTGLPTAISGIRRNSFEVPELPSTSNAPSCPLEASFSENRTDQLIRCGIVPLTCMKGQFSMFLPDSCMAAKQCSLGHQFLLSLLIHLVFKEYEAMQEEAVADDLEARLSERINAELHRWCPDPGTIAVVQDGAVSKDGTPLTIRWRPAKAIHPAGRSIEFHFLW